MAALSKEQVAQFNDQGFVMVKGVFNPEADLDPIIREYYGILDRLADQLFEAGEIKSRYEDLSFSDKLMQIQTETGKVFHQHFDFSLPQGGIKFDTPIWTGKAVFDVLRNKSLLDAVESLIGPEIYANPVQHVRLKTPEAAIPAHLKHNVKLTKTPWHQDNGVVTPDADDTNMITVWFPLWDAPVSAGPLRVVPYSHRGGLVTHCPSTEVGVAIPDKLLDEMPYMALPMKRGDALFMHKLTCHSSLPNMSKNIRWSFDLRYHPVGQVTGRDGFPGFVARSRKAPETELHDAGVWSDRWIAARNKLAAEADKVYNRWDANAQVCA